MSAPHATAAEGVAWPSNSLSDVERLVILDGHKIDTVLVIPL